MSSGPELADEVRQSRTSIVLLIFSAAAIYYSTQIHLDHGYFHWNLGIAIVGVLFLIAAFYTLYKDWSHETRYRDSLRRKMSTEVETQQVELDEVKNKSDRGGQEDTSPVTQRAEAEEFPIEDSPASEYDGEGEEIALEDER